MNTELKNKYFVRLSEEAQWEDVTTKFDGIKILKISGMNAVGEAVNIFTQQWIDSNVEDMMVTTQDNQNNDVVIRQNVDISLTFIAGTRYSANNLTDTQETYDAFKAYICNNGGFYIKSAYTNKSAYVTCLKGFEPTTEDLHRGINSYILATATLHTLRPVE